MIEHDKSLRAYNTFGFDQRAAHFVEIADDEALEAAVREADRQRWPVFVLGGGSNLVLTRDIPGLVVQFATPTIHYTSLPDGSTRVSASAAVNWHRLVLDTVQRGLAGLENLSLIPGTAGAAPVQNIGAYGVELADSLEWLDAFHLQAKTWHRYTREECAFGYRDSLFKRQRGHYAIARIHLRLATSTRARHTHYRALAEALEAANLAEPTPQQVSDTVVAIRQSKLPDPAALGNAGSFFKNPVVEREHYERLKAEHPALVAYPAAAATTADSGTDARDGRMKLAAGWLLDSLGYRGYREGALGTHRHQALVMVNEGGGDGRALLDLATRMAGHVRAVYGVELEIEPVVI